MDENLLHQVLVAQREIQNAGGFGKVEIVFHANQIRSVRVTKHVDIVIESDKSKERRGG